MATITFDNEGTGARATNAVNLQVASNPAANHTTNFSFYNETDSTINIDFTLQAGHSVSTNDQAGNEIFIREGANQVIMAPLSGAVVAVTRSAISTTATTGVVVRADQCRTAHGTVSAEGERLIIETVTA